MIQTGEIYGGMIPKVRADCVHSRRGARGYYRGRRRTADPEPCTWRRDNRHTYYANAVECITKFTFKLLIYIKKEFVHGVCESIHNTIVKRTEKA